MMDQELKEKELKQNQTEEIEEQTEAESQTESESSSGVRPLLTWPPQYSLDELMTKTLSLVCGESIFASVVVYAVDPKRPHLLYSCLPPEYQNLYIFFGLLAVEAVFLALLFGFGCFSVVCQLLCFSKCQLEVQRMNFRLRKLKEIFQCRPNDSRDIGREIWILRQISKEIKELILFIELFNRCFPPCIFAFKLLCLSYSTLWYFFTIRHCSDFPFTALFYGYSAVALTLTYGVSYQRAFSIPEKIGRLKNEFLLASQKSTLENKNRDQSFLAEMKREVEGIRDVGVEVGSFHKLERESTPNFVDFRNVVSLLVTFP